MTTFGSANSAVTVSKPGNRQILVESVTDRDAQGDLTCAIDLRDGLAKACDTHLLLLAATQQSGLEWRDAMQIWRESPSLPGELQALLGNLRADIVHTHRLDELSTVGRAARQAGVPHIVHSVCGTITSAEKWQIDQLAALLEELSPLMIAPTEEAADRLPGSAQIAILPTGIDCERYVPGDRVSARRKIGLPLEPEIVGCASPLEGLQMLLHALFRMDPGVHLALFGPARVGKAERELIRWLGLEERVHVLGAWAKPELIYQAIDVYFHGPAGDCLPRAVLAAQACGKPVIACGPTLNRVLCPLTARLTPIEYMPTLLHSLRRSLDSPEPEVTRQFILDNWNIENTLEGYGDLFDQLSAQNKSGRQLA